VPHVFWNRVHNDPSRSWKIVDFDINRKHARDFLLVVNSNLGPILPRSFRDSWALYAKGHFSISLSYSGQNFGGVPFGVDPWCWGLTKCEVIFEEFQRMWSRYLNVTDGQTDGQTTCSKIAPCVASRGKKQTTQNTAQRIYPGLVVFYDTRSGNEVGLFYNAPGPTTRGAGIAARTWFVVARTSRSIYCANSFCWSRTFRLKYATCSSTLSKRSMNDKLVAHQRLVSMSMSITNF